MINEEPKNPMKTVYDITTSVFLILKRDLSDEINSNGGCFTLKKQINYSKYYHELLKINLFPKVKSDSNDEDKMKIGFIQLLCVTMEYIEIYRKNKELFYSYDREQIALEKYTELHKSESIDKTDLQLMFHKERYFECEKLYTQTDFYKKVGVLLENYHELFYVYARHIQEQIRTRKYNNEINEITLIKTTIFIEPSLLHFVYIKLSYILFSEISEEYFIYFFNLKNDFIKIEIKQGQTNKVYGLIGKLYSLIDAEYKEIWINNILKNLGLKLSTYKSKNKEYASAERKENLQYKILLDTLFEKYNELNDL